MAHISLQNLKGSIFYRLLKVIFILFVIAVLALYNTFFVFTDIKRVDKSSAVSCLHRDKTILTLEQIPSITLYRSNFANDAFDYRKFFESYNDYTIKEILKACYDVDVEDVYAMQRFYEIASKKPESESPLNAEETEEIQEIENAIITEDKVRHLDYSYEFFDINPKFEYRTFGMLLVIGNLAIILAFEIVRQLFYYIVVGKIYPRRYEGNNPS